MGGAGAEKKYLEPEPKKKFREMEQEKKYLDPEPRKNGSALQHCFPGRDNPAVSGLRMGGTGVPPLPAWPMPRSMVQTTRRRKTTGESHPLRLDKMAF